MRFHRDVTTAIGVVLLFSAAAGFAQEHFDVVSIKPVRSAPNGLRLSQDAGRIHYVAASFRELVARAYRQKDQDVEGPAWIDGMRFDVDATYPNAI